MSYIVLRITINKGFTKGVFNGCKARIEMRVAPDIKIEAERATALLGMNSLTLTSDVFDRFFSACQADTKPS